ncbi:unnamed protein product [Rotaria socialis]|uniref:Uncharacterized protein n=1 Tax=Rotaria socialis TaxID=392032 RepID=A0A818XJ58_9BILA|nr:unnamed protein product [Rotaria socialis]CAF3636657.1 unnamed protein product [Rotaria socialis]CAF3740425.1 unnamed protein product [Rotaria socialis]CAF4098609.1 unnamed protein product [Rotaria socialis]CAF4117162.1 unnamed protein product [Rotaria socialis]
MPSFFFYLVIFLLKIIHEHEVYSIPTCVIIDTNMIQRTQDEISPSNNRSSSSSSLLLKNLRMFDHQRSSSLSDYVVERIPISHIDLKQSQSSSLIDIDYASLKKSLTDSTIDRTFSPCRLQLLNELETQMVVPFEFRRLRIEQPDHHTKFLDDDPRETVPDWSTAVYERRSDPDGTRFCRICRDGDWTELSVCETVRCDAELLRANPRLVSQWGEIKAIDGGSLYPPLAVFAIYAFAYGPHCKRCESNGQWSRYALPELCSGIQFFGHSTLTKIKITTRATEKTTTATTTTTTTTTAVVTTTASMKTAFANNVIPKMRQNTTTLETILINKQQ